MSPPLNEEEKRKAVIKELERRIHRSACFQRVFRGADGELVLDEIMTFCGMYNDTFDPNPNVCAYNTGRRAVGIFINNCIKSDTEKAQEILKEKQK